MPTLSNKHRKKIRFTLYVAITVLIFLAILSLRAFFVGYQKYHKSQVNASEALAEARALEARQKELQDELSALQTKKGVEAQILDRFNVAQSGEGVAIIVDSASDVADSASTTSQRSFWQKILGFFWPW